MESHENKYGKAPDLHKQLPTWILEIRWPEQKKCAVNLCERTKQKPKTSNSVCIVRVDSHSLKLLLLSSYSLGIVRIDVWLVIVIV